MIRPESEIQFPPSEFQRMKANMLARMEALNRSSESLLGVITERLDAQRSDDVCKVEELTNEQQRLIDNMRKLART